MNDKVKKLNQAISRTNALYAKWLAGRQLSSARQMVVLALAAEPGISQKGIVSGYLVPKQTVSKEINLMAKEGLLELLPDDKDRRGKKIVMTEKGKRYTEAVLQPYLDMEARIEKRMTPEAYQKMIDGWQAYAEALTAEIDGDAGETHD